MGGIKVKLFSDLDFGEIESKGFNEAEVRAVIIDPILKELGFAGEAIMREKHFERRSGSKKQKNMIIPDYLLMVRGSFAWVLEAKASNQKIAAGDNVDQAYDYAVHKEIRSNYFALCNGLEFACFRTSDPGKPVLYFRISEIDKNWYMLQSLLSPGSFKTGKNIDYENAQPETKADFDYASRPLLDELPVKKRAAKRHFGVHGYFTKQSWNVVNEYIKNFSKKDDVVLDPFGGSGVTAIEALMTGRKGINIDLNPMAVFIVKSLLAPVKFAEFADAFGKVKSEYLQNEPKTGEEIKRVLEKYKGCKPLPLPKSSDVPTTDLLFSKKQTAQLALLKSIIMKQKNKNIKNSLLLCFSGTVTRVNLTYHISTAVTAGTGFGGNAAAFQYYRYRIAKNPDEVDVMQCFEMRYKNIRDAKKEIEEWCLLNQKSVEETMSDAQIIKGTATDLSFLQNESVDYIYTDPPYGKKIPYLDLSVMWNAWLDLKVTEADYKQEAIEGGEHNKSKDEYNRLISQSIQEMYRVLKFDRWLSFVFAHKDPEFWHLIINTAERCGFEYIGAVPQKNGQTSFKKRQNPFTVLSGQLIINFRKVQSPKAVLKANLGMDISEIVLQTVEGIIAKYDGATLEQINDELIIKGLELGFLDLLKKHYTDLSPILLGKFDYDSQTDKYNIKKNAKFQSNIDVKLRIRYYLISYLRRMERENKTASFSDIVLDIMPLLKNGITPDDQTILAVLEDIGEKVKDDSWRLKKEKPTLFGYEY